MKPTVPETRNSLIARLSDTQDTEAWNRFASIYQPLVFRLARSKGFQDADAHEISQEVMVAVTRAVERWNPDAERGRFRDWLFKIARNLMIKYLTRRRYRPLATGDSRIASLLAQHAVAPSNEEAIIELEYRREMFRWAAEQVQVQVTEKTWQAFWRSSVQNETTEEVSQSLCMSKGAIHVACSRVRSRLRKAIQQIDDIDFTE